VRALICLQRAARERAIDRQTSPDASRVFSSMCVETIRAGHTNVDGSLMQRVLHARCAELADMPDARALESYGLLILPHDSWAIVPRSDSLLPRQFRDEGTSAL
jgi:hypothetical protein